MTHNEFFKLLKEPELVQASHVGDFRDLLDSYPYFAPARLFYAKALQRTNSVLFGANLKFSSVYSSNRSWLYYYIYPEKKVSSEPYKKERNPKASGDYFDMISAVEAEGGDSVLSLKNLADRLRSARELVTMPSKPAVVARNNAKIVETTPSVDYFTMEENFREVENFSAGQTEEAAKKCIKERKYAEAIGILKQLNLNNPKKSVYFADQIRFLEKVIANTKS